MIRLFSTSSGLVLQQGAHLVSPDSTFTLDALFSAHDPLACATQALATGTVREHPPLPGELLAPLQSQEVWAAGVTYLRSRTARKEESRVAGGGSFYDHVYDADRPELFFKASPHRVAAPGAAVRIRTDSKWNVPEPELTLAISATGQVFGFTIGNDMSSRDIEGENPLYLPQAKVYDRCASLGPCLILADRPPGPDTVIHLEIRREDVSVFNEATTVGRIKRPLASLADWLFRDSQFPAGCYLMTGTGIVPPDSFTLKPGDEIRITIEPVGVLINTVIQS